VREVTAGELTAMYALLMLVSHMRFIESTPVLGALTDALGNLSNGGV
tara:strand:+ start:77 stop:217 length:141 start_codon:yes stop_codon:yes gene_type:complete